MHLPAEHEANSTIDAWHLTLYPSFPILSASLVSSFQHCEVIPKILTGPACVSAGDCCSIMHPGIIHILKLRKIGRVSCKDVLLPVNNVLTMLRCQ